MTTEEKAKAYDKAVEKIKYVIDHGVSVTNDGLKEIFPELKESEDERIKRWIKGYLEYNFLNSPIADDRIKCKEALAWLEKQKPVKWSEEDEELLQHCCGAVAAADYYTLEDKEEMEKWLKSLKQRMEGTK